jgi:hypothetical protein
MSRSTSTQTTPPSVKRKLSNIDRILALPEIYTSDPAVELDCAIVRLRQGRTALIATRECKGHDVAVLKEWAEKEDKFFDELSKRINCANDSSIAQLMARELDGDKAFCAALDEKLSKDPKFPLDYLRWMRAFDEAVAEKLAEGHGEGEDDKCSSCCTKTLLGDAAKNRQLGTQLCTPSSVGWPFNKSADAVLRSGGTPCKGKVKGPADGKENVLDRELAEALGIQFCLGWELSKTPTKSIEKEFKTSTTKDNEPAEGKENTLDWDVEGAAAGCLCLWPHDPIEAERCPNRADSVLGD